MKLKQREGITSQMVGDEMLILDLQGNNITQLNQTATLIWQNCDGFKSKHDLADMIVSNFDVDYETAMTDVSETIEKLCNLNLVLLKGKYDENRTQ